MWRNLIRYAGTIILGLVTLALGVWTWQGYSRAQAAYTRLETPFTLIPVTAATPTHAMQPAQIPHGPFPLTWRPDTNTLTGPDGATVFTRDAYGQWQPFLPPEIARAAPEGSRLVHPAAGQTALVDPEGTILYRWDEQTWRWLPQRETPLEITLDPANPTRVSVAGGENGDALRRKSSAALLRSVPELDAAVYGLGDGPLKPARVLRLGENGSRALILYTNDAGQTCLALDLALRQFFPASQSDYRDEASGFQVHALLISTAPDPKDRGGRLAYPSRPFTFTDGPYPLARALFDYTLALNNYYTNHPGHFGQLTGANAWKSDNLQTRLDRLSPDQLQALQSAALDELRADLKDLPAGDKLALRVGYGANTTLTLDQPEAWFVFRAEQSSLRYSTSGVYDDAFAGGEYRVLPGTENVLEVSVKAYERDFAVGGWLVETVRELTAGGAVESYLWQGKTSLKRSTTDSMVTALCGETAMNAYLEQFAGMVRGRGIVPRFDNRSLDVPVCGVEERPLRR